jgi:phage terminase large subunit-like protein
MDAAETDITHAKRSQSTAVSQGSTMHLVFAEERSSPDQIGALFGATKNGAESCLTMTPAKTISRAVTAFKGLTDKGLTKGSGRG